MYARSVLVVAGMCSCQLLFAQNALPLTDLSFFKSPGATWKIAGNVNAPLDQKGVLNFSDGKGILVNTTDFSNPGQDLYTNLQHGDLDLELDYMLAAGSNSGIYLQGRYEIQLLDSWGVVHATSGDNGGIYERWNDSKPDGQQGFDGHAPRQNASRAPGLWQHIKISFQAPRFSSLGVKTENAKILRLELNGIAIQENVELSGVTRGAMNTDEVPMGPLRFQGDHGKVAFRNMKVSTYDKPRPELLNLKYTIYKGKYETEANLKNLPPEAQGSTVMLSSNVNNLANEFLILYTGTIKINEPGEYNFNLNTAGGKGYLKIKDQLVVPETSWRGTGKVTLPAGEYPFELYYSKFIDYAKPSLGLAIAGPGIREYIVSDANVANGDAIDPILINAPVNTMLRSFVDIDTVRVTHAVNVGSALQVHYTYDLDKGMIVQVWRGGFLDATPMWHSRGDGSSRPLGMKIVLGKPLPAIEPLTSSTAAWTADTTGLSYRPKGYVLDKEDQPTFKYQLSNTMVSDQVRVLPNGQGLHREILVQDASPNLYLRIALADNIETLADGLYILNDKTYYLRLEDPAMKPIIREVDGKKEMIIPVQNKISYSILF